jgi:rRNA maturation RNase YbeY
MPIHFFQEEVSFKIPSSPKVKKWITAASKKEGFKVGELNYILCNDSYLHKLNVGFLNHDTLTDIITFDYTEDKVISGDIFISLERVEENSEKFKSMLKMELFRVMIHGALHLMGYKDKNQSQKKLMRKKENEYLSLWDK